MTAPSDPVDDAIRALYQGPLGEFTAGKQALAKRLGKEAAPRAAEVKALKKPALSAWAVNALFAHEAPGMAALVAAGAAARAGTERAHAAKDGGAVRDALETIRRESARLGERAIELARAGGTPSDTVVERLRTNLEALALDPAHAAVAARGWLDEDLEPPGFGVLAALQLAADRGRERESPTPAAAPRPTAQPAAAARASPAPAPARAAEARAARERARALDDARRALEEAEARAATERAAADHAARDSEEATRAASAATARAEAARRAAQEAKRRADEAHAKLLRAREAVRRAQGA